MSNIEWTGKTHNFTTGCDKVSAGCKNCYAETMTTRLVGMGKKKYANGFKLTVHPESLLPPLKWRKPGMVFVNSMSDLFHKDVPIAYIAAVFAIMAAANVKTYQVLTKRPDKMLKFLELMGTYGSAGVNPIIPCEGFLATYLIGELEKHDVRVELARSLKWPLENVWLGTSAETQECFDERMESLAQCPAKVRFLSLEPLLGPIDMSKWTGKRCPIDWVIVGGESGGGARPCNVDWVRGIVEQCQEASIPVFVKQLGRSKGFVDRKGGNPEEWPPDLRVREFPG